MLLNVITLKTGYSSRRVGTRGKTKWRMNKYNIITYNVLDPPSHLQNFHWLPGSLHNPSPCTIVTLDPEFVWIFSAPTSADFAPTSPSACDMPIYFFGKTLFILQSVVWMSPPPGSLLPSLVKIQHFMPCTPTEDLCWLVATFCLFFHLSLCTPGSHVWQHASQGQVSDLIAPQTDQRQDSIWKEMK